MKVILYEDVPRLGKSGEVVTVAPGYFRNFLSPKNFAVKATPQAMKDYEHRKKAMEKVAVKEKADAEKLSQKLSDLKLVMKLKAGENDRLFGSVTTSDIADKLEEAGYEIDRKKIHLSEPIKSLGEFPVEIKLFPEVVAKVTVVVEKAE